MTGKMVTLVDFLFPASSALMDSPVEINPLILHLRVGLKLHTRLTPLISATDEIRQQVLKEQCIHTLALPFRPHSDEEHLQMVHMLPFECLQQIVPSEREEFAFTFLDSLGEGTSLGSTKLIYMLIYWSICFSESSE